jgi:hypothetical protein
MHRHRNMTFLACCALAGALLFLCTGQAVAARTVRQSGTDTLEVAGDGQPPLSLQVVAPIRDVLQIGDVLYVACGPIGVLLYDLGGPGQPPLIGRLAQGRNIIKLAYNGQLLLAVSIDYSAQMYSLADPRNPAPLGGPGAAPPVTPTEGSAAPRPVLPPPPPPGPAPVASWSRVTGLRNGWITVTAPPNVRIQVGDRFMVRSQRRVARIDPTSSHRVYAPANEEMGMFLVTRVRGNAASGPLPRGTVARLGDLAEPTSAPMSVPLVGPQLWYGMGRFYGSLMPMIAVGGALGRDWPGDGVGLLSQFTLEYYFKVPIKIGVQAAPLGIGAFNQTAVSTEVRALLSFSSSYFELGVSPGAELHLVGAQRFLLGWMIRLGSLDGLNLILHNAYSIGTVGNPGRVDFASINGEVSIPVAQRYALHLVGGGASSYAYGTLGLKHYLRGGGGPGTLIIHAGAGAVYLSDRCLANRDSTNYAQCLLRESQGFGPALSLGLDARF